jgi:hypothetical protein
METEGIKVQYFKQQLEKGIRDILEAQRFIATSRIYQKGHDRVREQRSGATVKGRSGVLMAALTNPRYRISPDGSGVRNDAADVYPISRYEATR